jgi:hypothetical protein
MVPFHFILGFFIITTEWARAFYFQYVHTISHGHKSGLSLVVHFVSFFAFSRSFLPPFSLIISHALFRRSGRAPFLKNIFRFGALRLPDFKCFFKNALQCFGGCLSRVTYHSHRTASCLLRALCLCVPLQPPPRHPFATSFRFDYTTGAHLGGDNKKSVFLLDFVPLIRR